MALSEQLADRLTGGKLTEQAVIIADLQEENRETAVDLALVRESLQRLEQALYSPEWRWLTAVGDQEFTRAGLKQITDIARLMRIKNPIIKRGVAIKRLYVFAQGMSVSAASPEINAVIQAFMDDERNQADLTGHQARGERETDLQTDGNLFLRFFVNPTNGRVRVRAIDTNEIADIVTNPDDSREPWFYRRNYSTMGLDGQAKALVEFYPDWRFLPRSRLAFADVLATAGGMGRIVWDTPVMHVAVNRMGRWGVCEFYDAQDWALAYKSFLEQLASVWQALARWAAKLTVQGGRRGVAAAKTKLNTTLAGGSEGNPPPTTGATFIASEGVDLQPFRTAGATMSADDGRRLQLMAAMSFGFPETFYGDADAGSLATAKSLDRPTELLIIDRQTLWRDIHQSVFQFVLTWAVKAPQGALRGLGRVVREPDGNQVIERVVWNADVDGRVVVAFPPVIEHDIRETIGALADAQTLAGRSEGDGIPLETAVHQMLIALGLDDVDEVMSIWREGQDARAARAEQMAAQMAQPQASPDPAPGQGQNPNDSASDGTNGDATDPTIEAVWQRQVTAVTELLTRLEESLNGHSPA